MAGEHYSDLKTPGEMAAIYQTALLAFDTQPIQSYTLPTGVSVTRSDLRSLREAYEYWRKMAHREDFGLTTVAVQSGAL